MSETRKIHFVIGGIHGCVWFSAVDVFVGYIAIAKLEEKLLMSEVISGICTGEDIF